MDFSLIPIVWDDDSLPPPAERAAIEQTVRDDLTEWLDDLEAPADLCFHHIGLSKDHEGPSVHAYGVPGSEAIHCAWSAATEWQPLSDVKKG